jgi:serine/threonine-protein kinase
MSSPDSELVESARSRLGLVLRDKYRLDSILGVGGMAVVYKATHRNQAEFAIKMLHTELSVRESLRKRFLREGYAANSVKHPGVVAIVDDDVSEDGAAFLVMELLHGAPVDTLMTQSGGRLTVPVACAILDQLLDVLSAAHEKGIVHRDVKPANLFLTTDGVLKVLDFGIARVRDAMTTGESTTGTGVLLGTPAYMAPEQARGKSTEIDARTDLWAAAATFFTLVSGRVVHAGDNAAQLLISAATAVAPSVTTVIDVPDALARVIDRALSYQPSERFSSAAEMRDALRAATSASFGAPPSRSLLAVDALDAVSARGISAPTISAPNAMHTAQPVSSNTTRFDPPRAPARRVALPLQVLAGVALAVVTAVAVKALVQPSATVAPEAIAKTNDAPLVTTTTTTAPTASTIPSASAQITIAPTPSATVFTKPVIRPHASTNCNPPYYIDSENRTIFKKECL